MVQFLNYLACAPMTTHSLVGGCLLQAFAGLARRPGLPDAGHAGGRPARMREDAAAGSSQRQDRANDRPQPSAQRTCCAG